MTYAEEQTAQKDFKRRKTALTRAWNARQWQKVIDVVTAAYAHWDDNGIPYPDNWHLFERRRDDARFYLQRGIQ